MSFMYLDVPIVNFVGHQGPVPRKSRNFLGVFRVT